MDETCEGILMLKRDGEIIYLNEDEIEKLLKYTEGDKIGEL